LEIRLGPQVPYQVSRRQIKLFRFSACFIGFASIGHSVWIFDGSADVFESGCREADVLIVDSARLAALSSDWQHKAAKVMRNPQILLHDRATYQLRKP
jgi:hypothetical protein